MKKLSIQNLAELCRSSDLKLATKTKIMKLYNKSNRVWQSNLQRYAGYGSSNDYLPATFTRSNNAQNLSK